ncbi:MAG: hypothetical protein AMXMBFR64_51850 [Myxococcales bacterium]
MVALLVAEKPSVARDLARVLGVRGKGDGFLQGDDLWITWCVGHLVELCEPHEHDPAWRAWSAGTLPMLPDPFRLRPVKSGAKQLRIVERLLRSRDVTSIVNACDAGREGELIFRLVAEHAGCRKPVKRLWLSSLTDQAVRDAMRAMRPASAYDALGDAARCRSEADWLVGLNATRALTLLGRRGGSDALYTVGRVQTPTLAMLVRREEEIEAFVSEPFWQVKARFGVEAGSFVATWHRGKQDRLPSPEEAGGIAAAIDAQIGTVASVERKTVRERPPLLFDLTTLQREANRRYGLSASATLEAAQALYERHKLLTYPRTDSRHLTSDMAPRLPDVLEGVAVGVWAPHAEAVLAEPLRLGRVVDDAEVGDHHAIIPTGRRPDPDALPPTERKVLDLVVRRFLAALHPEAIFDTARVEVVVVGHAFAATGKVVVQEGWLAVEPPPRRQDEAEPLPPVRPGEPAVTQEVRVHQGETQPPKRHTEATLLGAMERAGQELEEAELRRAMKEAGLGTPATRAAIIEGLLHRGFVARDGKSLAPTALGRALIGAVPVEELKSPALTGAWERRLADVAAGRLSRSEFMAGVREHTAAIVGAILGAEPPAPSPVRARSPRTGGVARGAGDAPGGGGSESAESPSPGHGGGRRRRTTAAGGAATSGAPSGADPLGRCPVCGTPVHEGPRAFSCARGRECSFVIFKTVAGRKVTAKLVQVLLGRGESTVLDGFRSKAGKRFSARLALDAQGQVAFRFDDKAGGGGHGRRPSPRTASAGASPTSPSRPGSSRSKSSPPALLPGVESTDPGAPASDAEEGALTAAGSRATPAPRRRSSAEPRVPPTCPACHEGTIIRGHRGWGCSRWRDGCTFVVWFDQGGRPLSDGEADRLLREGRTRLLDALPGPAGNPVRGRLVLDLSAPGNVRVEPSRRAPRPKGG